MTDDLRKTLLVLGEQLTQLQFACEQIRRQIFVAVTELPHPTAMTPPAYMSGRWNRRDGDKFNVPAKKESKDETSL